MNDQLFIRDAITYSIPKKIMKALLINCLRVDIPDINDKAEVVKELVLPLGFDEIGTGTNRIAFYFNGVVFKIAMDRRGLIDNYMEFKRSIELPGYLAKCYETNYLVNVDEYVRVLEQWEFAREEMTIISILKDLSNDYLFDDLGFNVKNSCNWGKRETRLNIVERKIFGKKAGEFSEDLVILDYGYLYKYYEPKEKVLKCPKCGKPLRWNPKMTGFICSYCNAQPTPSDIRRRMDLTYEELENKIANSFIKMRLPNLVNINEVLLKLKKESDINDLLNQ